MTSRNIERQDHLPEDQHIAIVGMSCLFPESADLMTFWQNIINGNDCIREVGADEWNIGQYYESYSQWHKQERFEKIYCKRGGFITGLSSFDPLKFGIMPKTVDGADPDQMLALRVACEAIADAGYDKRPFNAEKAQVIIGRTSAPAHGSMNAVQYGVTVNQMIDVIAEVRPDWDSEALARLAEELRRSLKPCSADTVPGVMPNILAGRIAGKLGFKGKSLVLDAACASSLIAVELAVADLRAKRSDLALAGGVFVNSFAAFYQLFSRLGALSHTEQIRPFDQAADGTLLGEGIGMIVLKRLKDAIRDGDRIYASIIGVGSSSDGRGTSMLAPSVEGEAIALTRAYEDAGVSPQTVSLLEAHGTGTAVGDVAEMQAVEKVFGAGMDKEAPKNWCALGSIKSMIGHCQAASGMAGLIKAALSLYQRVLPPTLNVEELNHQIDWQNSPCYVNSKTRPWIHAKSHPYIKAADLSVCDSLPPRRAAVSAFGFGGANAHIVLEESADPEEWQRPSLAPDWETEVITFIDQDRPGLIKQMRALKDNLERVSDLKLKDLAFSLNRAVEVWTTNIEKHQDNDHLLLEACRMAVVCRSTEDLKDKLTAATQALASELPFYQSLSPKQARSIYFSESAEVASGKLAFILPGLGAAYPGMLSELCLHFPEIRAIFDFVDDLAAKSGSNTLPSQKIFPPADLNGNFSSETSASLAA